MTDEECPRCGYTWTYRGILDYRRTCPNCGKSFSRSIFDESDRLLRKGLSKRR